MLLKCVALPSKRSQAPISVLGKKWGTGLLAVLALLAAGSASRAQAPGRGARQRPGAANKAAGSDVQPTTVFAKFPDWVASVAFAPDSKTLAAGSYGVVKLFDVVEKQEIAALVEPAGFVKAVAFSADGKTLVTGSYQSLLVWDVASRKVVRALKGHRGYVTSVAFSPDEKTLVSASDDETVRLWDAASGAARGKLPGILQPALAVAFSRDGRLIAVATGDATRPTKKGTARVYDAAGRPLLELEGHNRIVTAVAFSPNGGTLATASADESIKLWDAQSGKEIRELEGHSRPVNSLAFLADGKWLFSVCGGRAVGGNELKLWDLASGKDVATVPAHEGPINQLALSGDGKYLATASLDKTAKVFEVAAILSAAGQGLAKPGAMDAEFVPEPPALPQPPDAQSQATTLAFAFEGEAEKQAPVKPIRVGIIGLDTSHAVAFTQILNDASAKEDVSGCRIVAAYPKGSPDIKSSTERVPEYTKKVVDLGVEIVNSIDELV
ncbi:MAG: WD40 repeat domain-containing protein, partial [Deltaproteobacteria bacterium]